MSAELMMVLSMRRREVAFQPQADAAPAPANAATPRGQSAGPALLNLHQGMVTPRRELMDACASGSHLPCESPHSVRQVAWTAAYNQFGYVWHWITQVAAHYAVQRQTTHLAMQYAQLVIRQRMLSNANGHAGTRLYSRSRSTSRLIAAPPTDLVGLQQDLQVLGLTCVFAAAKIEEVHPPKASELAQFSTEYGAVPVSAKEIVEEEGALLQELKWNLHPTTPYSWLLFLLVGEALDQPLFSTRDFALTVRDLSGRHELFTNAIQLIDVALLDGQAVEYLPSVLAGAALLLVDPMLEFFFTAHFLQLDPKVLWDCKSWLSCVAQTVNEFGVDGSKQQDRWNKIVDEDLVFVQTHVAVPTHLAYGVLAAEPECDEMEPQEGAYMQEQSGGQYHNSGGCDLYGEYCTPACVSPSSSDTYGCFCKGSYHVCGNPLDATAAPSTGQNVYHYKFGWQHVGESMGFDANPPVSTHFGVANFPRYA